MTLGKRHIEMVVNGKYSDMIVRTITKVKSGDNGFERYYATIDHKRVEVFLNPKGVTGAAFRSEAEYEISVNDTKVSDFVGLEIPTVDLGDDCDGDLEALENELTPLQQFAQNEWFLDRASEFEFHPIMHWCGRCNEREAHYNGITRALNYDDERAINGTIFQFCKVCRDDLVIEALKVKPQIERIGA